MRASVKICGKCSQCRLILAFSHIGGARCQVIHDDIFWGESIPMDCQMMLEYIVLCENKRWVRLVDFVKRTMARMLFARDKAQ